MEMFPVFLPVHQRTVVKRRREDRIKIRMKLEIGVERRIDVVQVDIPTQRLVRELLRDEFRYLIVERHDSLRVEHLAVRQFLVERGAILALTPQAVTVPRTD